jgi:hypothetical protein
MSRLVAARATMLGRDARFAGLRYQQIDVPAQKVAIGGMFLPLPPPANPAVEFPTLGTMIDLFNVNSVVRRSMILRFQAGGSTLLPWQSTDPISSTPSPKLIATLGQWFTALGLLPDGTGPGGPAASRWGLHARNRLNFGATAVKITSVVVLPGSSNRFTILAANATNPFVEGSRIHVHGATGCGTQGLNGDHVVVKATTAAAPSTMQYTVDQQQCCPGATMNYNGGAFAYSLAYTYPAIHHGKWARTVSKRTGRPFIGTRGRRTKRTCR